MRIFLCLTVTIVILFYKSGHTQSFNVPVRNTTPHGSFTTYQRVGIPMYYNNNTKANRTHLFTIVFLNDSSIQKNVKINISDSVHQLRWKQDGEKIVITPKNTKEIFRTDESGRKIRGVPLDSCWAFLVNRKKIRTYSITSELQDPLIAYIQKDEYAPIVPLTKDNLESMVKDNQKAQALAKKGKLLKAIKKYNQD